MPDVPVAASHLASEATSVAVEVRHWGSSAMGYVIRHSWIGCLLAAALSLVGCAVLAAAVHDHLPDVVSEQGGAAAWALAMGAALAAFGGLAWYQWRREDERRVCAIRLMGGPCALLYFSAPSTAPFAAAHPANLPTAPPANPPAAPPTDFPYDAHPAIAVTVSRVVHWPGCLISLIFDAAPPPETALDRLNGSRTAPRLQSSRGRKTRVPMPRPRHVLIFADAMPAPQFRALAISLACLQRGVTFVEHR